jgi:hypothetical protein
MPKMRKIALEAGKEQGIQEISPKATEELGVTCCFKAKAAERSGKKQGISVFTLQLSHAETGISFIQFFHKRFSASFQRSEAVPSAVLKTSASAPGSLKDSGVPDGTVEADAPQDVSKLRTHPHHHRQILHRRSLHPNLLRYR